jgi:ABC-type transport system substrate-binding protein
MKKILFFVIVALFLTGTMVNTPAATAAAAAERPQSGGIMKITTQRGPSNFGYPPEIASINAEAVTPCMESLLGYDGNLSKFKGLLATGYKLANDFSSITITLRKGVKFHDGTALNAQAAKWNIDLIKAAKIIGTETFKSIDVIDDYTIRITLTRYDNTLLHGLATGAGRMVSPTAVEKNGLDWARRHPVGTGPFKFSSFERDVSLKYVRFDDYWGGKPYLDGIEFYYLADQNVQQIAMQREEVNVLARTSPKQAKDLATLGKFVFYKDIPGKIDAIFPSAKDPKSLFGNLKVREAVEYSINRDDIAKTLGYGVMDAVNQFCPPNFEGYDKGLKGRAFDPAKAKQLLAEAGYPNGIKTKLYVEKGNVDPDIVVAIQSDLKLGGIDAEIVTLETAAFDQNSTKGWQNGLMYFSDAANPPERRHISRLLALPNQRVDVFRPAGWAEMMQKLFLSSDLEVQEADTKKAVRTIYDNAMVIPLWTITQPYVMRPYIRDPGFATMQTWYPAKAWISK